MTLISVSTLDLKIFPKILVPVLDPAQRIDTESCRVELVSLVLVQIVHLNLHPDLGILQEPIIRVLRDLGEDQAVKIVAPGRLDITTEEVEEEIAAETDLHPTIGTGIRVTKDTGILDIMISELKV